MIILAVGGNRKKRMSSKCKNVMPHETPNVKEHYVIGNKVLGKGHVATTYVCTHKETKKRYACKTIPKAKLLKQEDYDEVWREIQVMHHLSEHPNVARVQGSYEDKFAVHLVMEMCRGGELFYRITQKGHYSEKEAAKLMKTIVGVVEACHSLGVIHRDLKPENFLFDSHSETATIKVIDFGFSVFYKPGQTFSDIVGTCYYMAPEVLRKQTGPEVDVWSAGVILYILLRGHPPFWAKSESAIFQEILHGEIDFVSDPWPSISESAKDLIKKMLDKDPEKRISAHEVLCHPWIVDDSVAPDKPLDPAVLTRLKHFSTMNKLQKMALRIIAERLSEEEIGGLKELFKMIDEDNSGTITFEELKDSLKSVGCDLMESEIKSLMEAADIDNNGTIDYGEFLAATLHLNKMEREENLVAAFAYFDKDGSGYITIEEIQQACKDFGLGNMHLDEIINEIDQDNDGRINYSEFAAMMRKGGPDVGRSRKGNYTASILDVLVDLNRFPSTSYKLTLSPRSPISTLPKVSESAVAETETGSSEPEPDQIVPAQPPSWEPGLFAVVMIGGRQYIVHPGRHLTVQRLKGANVNDKIALHKVLLVGTDTSCYIGKPIVTNAVVYATVEEQGLDPKVIVFKYKKKKHYRRNIGHRQPNTRIRINSIMGYENYPKVTMDDIKSDEPGS
ncbi:Calcium-dependent protein kinase 11 [Glycine soja]